METGTPIAADDKRSRLLFLRIFVFGGFAAAVFYHFFLMPAVFKCGSPYNSFLFNPAAIFSDFNEGLFAARNLNPYLEPGAVFKSSYLPLGNLIGWILTLAPNYIALSGFALGMFIFAFWAAWKHLNNGQAISSALDVAAIVFCSYPFLYLLNRGNFEFFIFILLFFSVRAYSRGQNHFSAALIGAAAAIKPFPVVFAALFFERGKIRCLLSAAAAFVILSFASLLLFQGGVLQNLRAMSANMQGYSKDYVYGIYGLMFGHSLFGALKIAGGLIAGAPPELMGPLFVKTYFAAAACAGILLMYFAAKEQALWKKTLLLVICMNLLPYASGDYKLIHLLIPLFLFIGSAPQDGRDAAYLALFGFLMIPKHYYYFWGSDIPLAAVLNPAAMLAFALLLVLQGKRSGVCAC